jgi:hypothetical protein
MSLVAVTGASGKTGWRAVGLKRVVLVSSLCAGRWQHPLNLFGLILVWKRLSERWLEESGLDWTVVRPGGLSEDDSRSEKEGGGLFRPQPAGEQQPAPPPGGPGVPRGPGNPGRQRADYRNHQ